MDVILVLAVVVILLAGLAFSGVWGALRPARWLILFAGLAILGFSFLV